MTINAESWRYVVQPGEKKNKKQSKKRDEKSM